MILPPSVGCGQVGQPSDPRDPRSFLVKANGDLRDPRGPSGASAADPVGSHKLPLLIVCFEGRDPD